MTAPDLRHTIGAYMTDERRRDQLGRIDERLAAMKADQVPVRTLERIGRPILRLFRGGRR